MAKAEVDYLKPARLNNQLQVKSKIVKMSAAGIIFEQWLEIEQEGQVTILNKAIIKVACLKLDSFTPCRIPANVKEEFQRVC